MTINGSPYANPLNRIYILFGWVHIVLLAIILFVRNFWAVALFSIESLEIHHFVFEAILLANGIAFSLLFLFYLLGIHQVKRGKFAFVRRRRYLWVNLIVIGVLNGIILFDAIVYFFLGDRFYLIVIGFFLLLYYFFPIQKKWFQKRIVEE